MVWGPGQAQVFPSAAGLGKQPRELQMEAVILMGPAWGLGLRPLFQLVRCQEQGQEPGFSTAVSSLCVRGPSEQKTHWG